MRSAQIFWTMLSRTVHFASTINHFCASCPYFPGYLVKSFSLSLKSFGYSKIKKLKLWRFHFHLDMAYTLLTPPHYLLREIAIENRYDFRREMRHMFGQRLLSFSSDTYLEFFNRPAKYCPSRAVFSGPCNAFIRINAITNSGIITDISKLRPHATSANGRSAVSFSYGVITWRNKHFDTNLLSCSIKRPFAHG